MGDKRSDSGESGGTRVAKPQNVVASAPSGGEAQRVIVELRVPRGRDGTTHLRMAADLSMPGFELDSSYAPVPVGPASEGVASQLADADEEIVLVRGLVDPGRIAELQAEPQIRAVWRDTPIAPFTTQVAPGQGTHVDADVRPFPLPQLVVAESVGVSPIEPCDCSPRIARGTIQDVAAYLGVDEIWRAGQRGQGIVVGVVDGGIAALDRPVRPGETPRIEQVTSGWPATDWGTTAAAWNNHGDMTATDVLGMAPEAHLYDIRISDGGFISNAVAGYQWAIDEYRKTGRPQVLSNSWGIYQEAWDPQYARDPQHPFTRKVVEAIEAGILVLFAAGNCGQACPSMQCGADVGPGRSIWGANGHPRVMTVGAANRDEQWIGYTSQGPATLDAHKPDFCSVSHFQGFTSSDNGTSAATPIAAGVVALLKQADPALTQEQARQALTATARPIGSIGWNPHAGAGIIQANAAYTRLTAAPMNGQWERLGGTCIRGVAAAGGAAGQLDCFAVGADSALWRKRWDGTAWQSWENLGGVCLSAPAALAMAPDCVDAFVIGPDSALWHKQTRAGGWSAWQRVGGTCIQGVAVVSRGADRLDCFTVGVDNAVWYRGRSGTAWGSWQSLGGTWASAPAAVADGPDGLSVFVIGTDSAVWQRQLDGSGWRAWERLGGTCLRGVAVASRATGSLDCFAVGVDSGLWSKHRDGTTWRGWQSLGGVCLSAPAAVVTGADRIDTFVIGADGALWRGKGGSSA